MIPNHVLTNNVVKNYTKGGRTKSVIEFKIPSKEIEEVSEMLLETVKGEEDILDEPEPEIKYTGMEEGRLNTELQYWMKESKGIKSTKSSILKQFSRQANSKGLFQEDKD